MHGHKMFLIVTLLLVFASMNSYVTTEPTSCTAVKFGQLVHITQTSAMCQSITDHNCLTFGELLKCSLSDLKYGEGLTDFIIHQGSYIVNQSKAERKLPSKKSDRIIVRGEPNTIIKCAESVPFKVAHTFGKARNTSIQNFHLRNCKEILMGSDFKKVHVVITNCTFTNSCLQFTFTKKNGDGFVAQIIIRNTTIKSSNCTNGTLLLNSSPDILINITLSNINVSNNISPFLKSLKADLSIVMVGNVFFRNNQDFIMHLKKSKVYFTGANVEFFNNTIRDHVYGTPIYVKCSEITFKDSTVVFNQNKGSSCGAITAMESTRIIFEPNAIVNFTNNSGRYGGAVSLYSESVLTFWSHVTLNFIKNAALFGGAVYVEDRIYSEVSSVLVLLGDDKLVKLRFQQNSALFGGNQIYGGWVDWFLDRQDVTTNILEFSDYRNSDVASDPVRICLCSNGHVPNCNITNHAITIQGCVLHLSIVAVGQRFNPVGAYVQAESNSQIHISPRIKSLQTTCTNVKYKIDSKFHSGTLFLKPYLEYANRYYDISDQLLFKHLIINVHKEKCGLGFVQKENDCECTCSSSLTLIGLNCDTNGNGNIIRSKQQWVGVTYTHTTANAHPGIIAHERCPFDYCRTESGSKTISLIVYPDKQCTFNRSGVLCGGCQTNFSRVLGSIKCKRCSNRMLYVIIPCGLLAGLVLVMLLITLDLTVSVGTINGLILYANVIQAQHNIFFSSDITFPSMFIAWLNLDLGIESCLFDGLNSYTETWLQYCFPLYIWIIVATIIVSSRYSSCISKLCSTKIVQVLATLLLLSYTKLQRLAIDVIMFTRITYPDGYTKAVWLYDGNIDYVKGKHIPLFFTTILLQVFLTLLYPFSLFSIQWLLKLSHYRALVWVQRLKPFFDAYTGPYRASHRYWTGLLLLVRIIFLFTFTMYRVSSPTCNLLVITVVSVSLLAYFAGAKGMYKDRLPNCLEVVFLCNLALTSAAVQYQLANYKQHYSLPINISTGVTIAIFLGIIFYHVQRRVMHTKIGSRLKARAANLVQLKDKITSSVRHPSTKVTTTTVDLKELLLE